MAGQGDVKIFEPEFSQVVSGLPGAEGPVFSRDGSMYVVAPEVEDSQGHPAGTIHRVHPQQKQTELLVAPSLGGYGGIPAGCQCDKEGNLWVADMRLGILQVKPDGTFTQVCTSDADGGMMQGCNDCSLDYSGSLWVTAPAGPIAPQPYTRSMQEPFGSVYCRTASGSVHKVATGFLFSNGLAVQHDSEGIPKTLIVAETGTKSLWGFEIIEPGKVGRKFLWAKVPGEHEGGPDGMDFDEAGNLLVANWGSGHLEVYAADGGSPWARIKCPFSKPSNLHFRPDSNQVYVTEHENHALWSFTWTHKGRKEFCQM